MRQRAAVTQLLEALGAGLIAVGFGVLWLPLGLFVAGLMLLIAANAPGADRPAPEPRGGPRAVARR